MDERAKRVEQLATKVLDAEEYPEANSVLQGRREMQIHGPGGWRERKTGVLLYLRRFLFFISGANFKLRGTHLYYLYSKFDSN